MAREPKYSYIDPRNGNVKFNGPLEVTKSDHRSMPPRTEAYLPGDEKGHLCASSLSPFAVNSTVNVVPQNGADINHGAWLQIENGERAALKAGASIHSEKIAYVDGQIGDRPHTFANNDHVTFPDGHNEIIYFSLPNEAYANQSAFNELSAAFPDTFGDTEPTDVLRSENDIAQYAELMESSDLLLPNIADEYTAADYYGLPAAAMAGSAAEAANTAVEAEHTSAADISADDIAADCDNDI